MMHQKLVTIYKSSAGSGKTYTLVKEYLVIVLANPNEFRHVLAVTFTNKATEEMKKRVIHYLVDLKKDKNEALRNDLKKRLPEGINIKKNAELILRKILHHYSDFAITTIDSFFISVVRSLARELSLPARYDVELNQSSVAGKITTQLFDDINTDDDLRKWLKDFMLSKLEEEKGWKIEKEMKDFAMQLFSEEYRSLEKIQGHRDERVFLADLQKIKSGFENGMRNFGQQFVQLMDQNNLSVSDFYNGKTGFATYMTKLVSSNGEDFTPKARTLSAAEAQTPEEIFSKKSEQISNEELSRSFRQVIHSAVVYYNTNSVKYFTALSVLKLFHVAGIVHHLDQNLKKFRDKNNLLMISDTNLLLKDILKNQDDAPFIYEKAGNKYRYFLVDEFQDTSDFQWYNLLPLITNSLASGYKILIVGDAKQSIYRWRGGNMNLLLNGVERGLNPFRELIETVNLADNYRSRKEIVSFNNTFFSGIKTVIENDQSLNLSENNIFHKAYHPDELKQSPKVKTELNGFIRLQFIDDKSETDDAEEVKWKDHALKYTLAVIENLTGKGYSYSDIAILVRKNSEGSELIDYLYKNGIRNVVSGESLLIKNSHRVNFIVNLLRYLVFPNDEVIKAQLLFYYRKYLHHSTDDYSFEDVNQFHEKFSEEFIHKADYLKSHYLPELVEELILIFKLNETPDAYIQRFQDVVIEFCEKQSGTPAEFINWWIDEDNQDKISVIMPDSEDAITVISMHKSKGLQYPIVIIPFLDWELKPKSTNTLWVGTEEIPFADLSPLPVKVTSLLSKTVFKENYEKEVVQTIIDNINLVYVAFTRPENQLYIYLPVKSEGLSRVSQLFAQVFRTSSELQSLFIETEPGVFEYGQLDNKIGQSVIKNQESQILADYIISPWQHKLGLKIRKDAESDHEEQDYGIFVHQLLSEIITEEDIKTVADKIRQSEQFAPDIKDQVQKQINFATELLKNKGWLKDKFDVKTEAEIALPDGNFVRPDRLMIKDNEVILVDYKTGLKDIFHSDQLKEYDKVLADTGYKVKEKYLLYLSEEELIKID